MKPAYKRLGTWVPLIIALSFAGGIWTGNSLLQRRANPVQGKLQEVLDLINANYVDKISTDTLIDYAIPAILEQLDPHSVYLTADEVKSQNEELEGSFSGIGISFWLQNDTINVVEVIGGGPSEAVGIMAGDRIVTVNGKSAVGKTWTEERVRRELRGDEGSKVTLGIMRPSAPGKTFKYDVTRAQIPLTSVDAAYRPADNVVYVKVNRFGEQTFSEFLDALARTEYNPKTDKLMVDLRGNGGGYMQPAVMMANEFLPRGAVIVSTRGREGSGLEETLRADGTGSFRNAEVVVLVDEQSASASEIFAGALQDNDRGLVIGRRSFGKGLVQNQFPLRDNSALRLTIARYYTPSGRCIQKSYKPGELHSYQDEILSRYLHGELQNADSIKFDPKQVFSTVNGRKVYGGGGIMPDIFVGADTVGVSSYYMEVVNAGLIQKYAMSYCDRNGGKLRSAKDVRQLMSMLPSDREIIEDFAEYARSTAGIQPRWYYINLSQDILVNSLKAWIARDAIGAQAFYEVYNTSDQTIAKALEALSGGVARVPLLPSNPNKKQNKR